MAVFVIANAAGIELDTIHAWGSPGESPLKVTIQAVGYAPELIGIKNVGEIPAVTLRPGHTLRGRIPDQSGKPLEGVNVTKRIPRQTK